MCAGCVQAITGRMASVKRRGESRFWTLCYRLPDGRRIQRSSGIADRDEALKKAIALEQASKLARAGKLTARRAFAFVAEIAASAGEPLVAAQPVGAFLEGWFATKRQLVAPATGRSNDQVLRTLRTAWADLWDGPLGLIEPADVVRWRDGLVGLGLAATTINTKMGAVTLALEDARRQGLLSTNPAEGLKLRVSASRRQRREAFSWEQFRSLVAAAPDEEWRLLILLAGLAGQRQQTCTQLRWGAVDLEGGWVRFGNPKGGEGNREVRVPIHPDLEAALRAALARIGPAKDGPPADAPVFPVLSRVRTRGKNGISSHFREVVLPRVGIVQPYQKRVAGKKTRTLAAYSFHSLRHFLTSALNQAGVTEAVRMQLVGHTSRGVHLGYTHTQASQLRAAVAALPRMGSARAEAQKRLPDVAGLG